MDIKEMMVLIKGDDKTEEIQTINHDPENYKIHITYKNGRKYPYNQNNVIIIADPKVITPNGQAAYMNDILIDDPKLILDFGSHIRIIQHDDTSLTTTRELFSLVQNGADNQNAEQTLAYLKDISQHTSSDPNEESFLQREMEKLSFVHPESALSYYLNQQEIQKHTPNFASTIFPFRFNLSQKAALENALSSSISVIEGPPGTGKTQTILNLIANFIMQEKSVAVVSNNNEAVKNVIDKMTKGGYGFLLASLGNTKNQDAFFANIPVAQLDEWDSNQNKEELSQQLQVLSKELNHLLSLDRRCAQRRQELRAWQLEQEHFEEYYAQQDVEEMIRFPLFHANPDRILSFLAETSLAKEYSQHEKLLYKLKLVIKYRIFDHKKLQKQELSILLLLQKSFYCQTIQNIKAEIQTLENQLLQADFDTLLNKHQQCSEHLFRKHLYRSHGALPKCDFTKRTFKENFHEFMKTFPVITSTTYALKQSIPQGYLLDYVIIDEASQVDILTGALVLSCCRNVVIVGDVKQLPQIVDSEIEQRLKQPAPIPAYNYFQHNILSSMICLYKNSLPREILREHYRCHPQIIEFCNQKYYKGELIPYTNTILSDSPLMLYKTSAGNHMRRVTQGEHKGRYNQRELDLIIEEVLSNVDFSGEHESIGFVTPYRKQANTAGAALPEDIASDTVHKYQGRERDVMIMSTVLDSTRDGQMGLHFVDNPQSINVAVSRAVRQFVLVTDHDLFFKKGKDISDLIRYIQYNTLDKHIVESDVISIFDLLYRQYSSKLAPLKAKMKHNTRYPSEEALRVLLDDILSEPQYATYGFAQGVLLRNLINNIDKLTPKELNFINNRASLDFVIYYKQDKACKLVIEVDGFAYHENNPEQLQRDALKDKILSKYEIPILRLPTNGSREREKIQNYLSLS